MKASRWLGISLFLFGTVCLLGTAKIGLPNAFGQGKDDKKVEISANPDKATVKAGESKSIDLVLKRGKDATKEVTLTAEVDPKDKGVTVKVDAKVAGDKKEAKLTVETTSKAEGEFKVIVKSKSEGSDDGTATVAVSVKKVEVAQAPPASGDKLEFKAFTPGKTFFTEQTTKTKQTMTVMGQKVQQNQEQTFMIQWTPKDMKDGNYVVEQQIVGVKMKIDIGGNNISYDSTLQNAKNPMTDFFEALMKKESVLTFTIGPDLTVKSIEGRDKFIKSLIDINPQMQNLLKAILSEDALKKMAEPTWWAYPANGVLPAKGATWAKDTTLNLGPIGNYTTKFTFTNKGEQGGKIDIGIKTALTYTAPTDKAGLPFVIQSADLKGDNGEGNAIFDRAKGRFDSSKLKMNLSGKIKIDVGNMTTDVDLNQEQEAISTTRDTLPADWEKKTK